jgi:prepilin-type N-terminal cleavage/methylation domain-containing protein
VRSIRTRAAFTLVELVVVIAILAIVLTLAVPAFSTMLRSAEVSLAENQFRSGVIAGRNAALQSSSGDGAAVFFYDAINGRLSILPCIHVATIQDLLSSPDPQTNDRVVERDVFVPVANGEPVQLPSGWTVRGYAPPNSISDDVQDPNGWYDSESWVGRRGFANWVFPETDFYDRTLGDQGRKRQTFLVRFKRGTGEVVISDRRTCLVVDVNADSDYRSNPPWDQIPRMDRAESLELTVRRIAARVNDASGTLATKSRWLGDESTDTVLARPVTELALVDERELANALGVQRLNRVTKSLYAASGSEPTLPATNPQIDTALFATSPAPTEVADMVNQWIDGALTMNGEVVPSTARIFTFQFYAGQLEEIKP